MSIGIGIPIDRAISVLQEAGAIRERKKLGWMQDRAEHAHERAFAAARQDPPSGVAPGFLRYLAEGPPESV